MSSVTSGGSGHCNSLPLLVQVARIYNATSGAVVASLGRGGDSVYTRFALPPPATHAIWTALKTGETAYLL